MVPGNTVDHIVPHRGDETLFWDDRNLQTLTKECHDKYKASEERGGKGFNQGSTVTGEPLNKDSHWYD